MKQSLKQYTPAPLWTAGSKTYWWWRNRGRHVWARTIDPRWRTSQRQLAAYRNRHLEKRCFILGNGPSLKRMDLSLLRNEITFGLNRIYLMFPELGFPTTYLVSVNELVLEQSAQEMIQLSIPKFLTWRARHGFRRDPQAIFLDTDFTGPEVFSGEVMKRIFEGFTVTFVAMQLAYYMGFSKAILIGVDHRFTTHGPANEMVVSQGDDPNHFAPNYFGRGFRWQLPDLEGSERAYHLALQAYQQAGRQILDATLEGNLTIFPKVDYASLF